MEEAKERDMVSNDCDDWYGPYSKECSEEALGLLEEEEEGSRRAQNLGKEARKP